MNAPMSSHMPRRRAAPTRRLHAAHVLLALALIALLLAQALDGIFTATGLLFLNIALPVPGLGRVGIAAMLAVTLQAAALAFDTVVSNAGFRTPWPLRASALLVGVVLLCAVQSLAGFLHFTQLENLSAGDNLRRTLAYDASSLNARVTAANQRIAGRYRTALSEEWTLAKQSRAGDDASGIPGCGPRCKGAIHRARILEARFATLAQPIPATQAAGHADAAALFATLQQRLDLLKSKLVTYKAFCSTMGWKCSDPLTSIVQDPVYRRLAKAMAGNQVPDRQRLVLAHVGQALRGLAHGEAAPITLVIVTIVALWPAMEFALLLTIRLALVAIRTKRLDALREEHDQLEEIIDLQSKITALSDVESILRKEEAA